MSCRVSRVGSEHLRKSSPFCERKHSPTLTVNSLQHDDSTVPLSDRQKPRHSPRQHTSMETGTNQTSNSCYYQLRRFRCVPKYLSTEATVTLVTSLILSRLDYCNSLLSLLPASSIHSLRCSQNCVVHPETKLKLTISLLCSNLSTGSQSRKEFSTR